MRNKILWGRGVNENYSRYGGVGFWNRMKGRGDYWKWELGRRMKGN
jgi:hypothetical protein